MPSDPSYGTTGFFSYLWVKRIPVYDVGQQVTILTNDTSLGTYLTADDGTTTLTADNIVTTSNLIRYI